jgi:hypothetical protein
MISDARGGHVSPGIYTEEKDVTYSVKSLGITSLGLVGETLYGPAFQNIEIGSWSEFVDYFGGTSTEKFKGNGLPKYELPYIAKSYLEESKRLNVVRVLGLSGYHAGPYWVISQDDKPGIILRSKMSYGVGNDGDICQPVKDIPSPIVKDIKIGKFNGGIYDASCVEHNFSTGTTTVVYGTGTTLNNNGCFSIQVTLSNSSTTIYNVSLDSTNSNYIYKVLGISPNGTTPIYIESIFENTFNKTNGQFADNEIKIVANTEYDNSKYYKVGEATTEGVAGYTVTEFNKDQITSAHTVVTGYEVLSGTAIETTDTLEKDTTIVKVVKYADYDDYLECYRAAQTPWIVSDALINDVDGGKRVSTVKKLFKFITISDGNIANYQVKVSIQNIRPNDGTFDVVVRDFYDSDLAPIVLERFSKCNLVEGDVNYIAYKIGTADGGYVSKSKYILVEMADAEDLSSSSPAGFLGYPCPNYNCNGGVEISYNTKLDVTLKAKKQYFGCTSIDADILSYKGKNAYKDNGDAVTNGVTKGFHMDSVLGGDIYVDGVPGFLFDTVSTAKVGTEKRLPRIIKGAYMDDTIYNDVNTRKFTVCFYGGFDGWDINREVRTNTDDYKSTKYSVNNSDVFSRVIDENGLNTPLNLPSTAITSDYYAYLAGYRVFANPQDIDINLFATPGIDWDNNTLLTEEVIDVIEDSEDGRGGDALYIMTSPKRFDAVELANNFEDKEINSSYACTYAPWVMYYDNANKRYIDLPVTKDVVRNMAATDNKSYPWFAPAGIERGNVNCVKADFKTTLSDEDALYEGRINPVKTFAQDGVKIWGNKTAYTVESPLNRINVRRLMIRVKKLVTNAAKNLIFSQYDDTLEKQFRGLIEPILADVKSSRGISDYRIITEVTPETRDQHILPAKILIKPTPALEYISLSFVVYPESVSFDEN